MLLFSLVLLVPLISCYEFIEPNVGHDCQPGENGTASIKYYFDKDENTYFPFYYKGCGGDAFNRYDNESSGPRMMDMSTCPGIPVSNKSCNTGKGGVVMRHPNGTEESMNKEVKCPAGHYCVETWPFGSGHGFCCNTANKEASEMDYSAAKCVEAKLKPVNKGDSLLVGRKCEHNFCPCNSTCKQGKFIAYCCKNQ